MQGAAAGRPASGSSSRSPPTSASPPTTRASGSRSSSAGSRPTAARRGCCRAASATSRARELLLLGRALSGSRGGGVGRDPPRGAGGRARRRGRRVGDAARDRPDGRARAHEVAAGTRARACRSTQHLANEAFALELSSRTDDFREGMARVPREAKAALRGPMNVRRSPSVDRGQRARARGSTRAGAAARRPCARCARAPSTRRGTRCSRHRGSWCRRGRSSTAVSTVRPTDARALEAELRPFNLGPPESARA